jgi:MFS transporter, PAT family, beta-lactamase induction signal transducer AmpG
VPKRLLVKETTSNKNPVRWIPSTWFAMGLPFVALATASAIMYKNMGISDTQIAFWTSLIMLPWTLKPLWGPFLEMFKTKKFFVYTTQIFTGVMFGLTALTLHSSHFFALSIAALAIIAISGATHDTAADGVYLNELDEKQQAKYVGWQGAFYNIAKIFSGGLLVYLAGELEKKYGVAQAWMVILFLYGGVMIILGLYNMRALPTIGWRRSGHFERRYHYFFSEEKHLVRPRLHCLLSICRRTGD